MIWANATEENIRIYTKLLDYLRLNDLPLSVNNCNNFQCGCHNDIIVEKYPSQNLLAPNIGH